MGIQRKSMSHLAHKMAGLGIKVVQEGAYYLFVSESGETLFQVPHDSVFDEVGMYFQDDLS